MKIEFEEWGLWNDAYESVVLHGRVDGLGFGIIFAANALAELFEIPYDPDRVESAFNWKHKEFMEEIARSVIEAGRLRTDGTVLLRKKDLLPYFEKRAATAPA